MPNFWQKKLNDDTNELDLWKKVASDLAVALRDVEANPERLRTWNNAFNALSNYEKARRKHD